MLILTRKVGEIIRIGDDILLTVVGVQGNNVRIGIAAPKEVKILREEIYQEIRSANLDAAAELGEQALPNLPDNWGRGGQDANKRIGEGSGALTAAGEPKSRLKRVVVRDICGSNNLGAGSTVKRKET